MIRDYGGLSLGVGCVGRISHLVALFADLELLLPLVGNDGQDFAVGGLFLSTGVAFTN